ncbi:MAG: murein biosynthesis integral membrane protein MurJ [Myxococcales bacterium]|nr:murein biosynthesis integral membrane protein MurJ [Myxococcales bacterium]
MKPVEPLSSPLSPSAAAAQSTVAGIRAAAILLAASNLLSRVLGYGRDWLIAFEFGATSQTDVYQASFTLPDLINHLLAGGALSVSLLPRMAELYAARTAGSNAEADDAAVNKAFSLVCSAMLVAALALVAAVWLAADPLIAAWFPGFTQQQLDQTVHLTRIVLPAQLFFLVGGLFQAVLLARQQFHAMALTPLLYNGAIIGGGLIGGQLGQIEGFSWGALVGALLGGLLVPVFAARKQVQFRFEFDPLHPEVRRFLWIAAPLMLGVSLTTVDEWLAKRYGSGLQEGAITWLMTARRVMLVPIGILGATAGQATGAYLAKLHAEKKREELATTLTTASSAVVGWSLIAGGLLAVLAEPVVHFLFQYGRFSARDATNTAIALQVMALAIPAWGAQQVLARAFYAVGDTWRPMIATTAVTVAALPLYVLAGHAGDRALPQLCAAGVVGIWLQAFTLLVLARRKMGINLKVLSTQCLRALIVATAAVAGVAALDHSLGSEVETFVTQWIPLVVAGRGLRLAANGAVAVAIVAALGSAVAMVGMPQSAVRAMRAIGITKRT